jgi:Mor family transcriptional regulator
MNLTFLKQDLEIKILRQSGVNLETIAKKYGVSRTIITRIIKGERI